MIKSIGLNNFRGFIEQEIELSRVNILIGENSSGKSSLIKFLLAAKQTIEEPEISNLILNGNIVDLGNYKESISFHEEDRNIEFSFKFGAELSNYFLYFFNPERKKEENKEFFKNLDEAFSHETTMTIELTKNLNQHTDVSTFFENALIGDLMIDVFENNSKELLGESPKCNLVYQRKAGDRFILENIGYDTKGFLSICHGNDVKNEVANKGYSDTVFYEIAYLLLCQNLLEIYLRNMDYLNPLTTKPQRIYFNKDAQSKYKENNLDKFANLVTNNSISSKVLKDFSKVLAKFGIVDDIKFSISKNFPFAEIKVKIDGVVSNIYDVGYGVSLQIPILFEAYIAEKEHGKAFLIEQPEIHLHPRFQAKFIDTLLSMGHKNEYIIETHSEHIIRMLQVIIKEKKHKINSDQIRIYFFSKSDGIFKISRHNILENGQLDKPFPTGFFDSSYLLAKSLMF